MVDNSESETMERINHAIKLTSTLISVVNEFIWGTDGDCDDLNNFLERFQSLGKVLSCFRNCCQGDQEFRLFVFQKLNVQNGPLVECVAELHQIHLRIESDKGGDEGPARLNWLLDKNQLLQYALRIEKHKNILALASQLMKDQSRLSEIMAESYPQDTSREKGKLRSEPPTDSSDMARAEVMEEQRSDLAWLFPGDFESRYLGIQERRIKGTGEWLLQSPIFKKWTDRTPGHTVLWGWAKPGAGKKFIGSKVIDHVKSQAPRQNFAVGYYFFDQVEQDQVSKKVLSSLIVQLALQARDFSVVSHTLLSRLGDSQQAKPSLEKLFSNLIETSKSFDHVFFVFDGLSEYNKHVGFMLEFVQSLAVVKMSLFVTSNSPPINLRSSLHAIAGIDLSARSEDIKMSIEKWVDNSPQFRLRLETGKCQDRFIKKMTTCANGMLLFVDLGMRAIIQQPTVNHIFSMIEQLRSFAREEAPYSSFYAHCIGNIRLQDSACSKMAVKILSWLLKAQQALTVNALREAISVEPGRYKLEDSDLPDAVTMVDICAGLITIDQSSGVVRLIHDTARQYLLGCSVVPLDFDYQMAMACLTYVSFDVSPDPFKFQQVPERPRPFFNYAARNLSFHINQCDESLTTGAFLRFIKSPRQGALYMETHRDDRCSETDSSPLVVAAQVGHLAAVRMLITAGGGVSCTHGPHRAALREAVKGHHYETVKLLLQALRDGRPAGDRNFEGASERDSSGRTVLHWASRKGYKNIVELLIHVENGVDIMDHGLGQRTPLHEAAHEGHEELVKMFLEKGIPLWNRGGSGRTALHEAAAAGHIAIVKLILKYAGTLPAAKLEPHPNPVRITDRRSNMVEVGDARLRNGVSAQDNELITPLHLAALGCHTEIFQLLLREGADIFALDKTGESVLHQAVRGGSKPIAELLVQVGADVGATNREGVTVLHRAATRGYTDIVQILLNNAVDTSPRLAGRTALQLAMEGGYEETASLLLDNTPEVLTSDELDKMLGHVSQLGYTGVVRLLLDREAKNINAALYKAVTGGHLETIKLLLGAGSDILSRHGYDETVLHTAAYKGYANIVKLLLDNGGDVRARSADNQTPLHMAARSHEYRSGGKGNGEIVRLLLEASADVNAKNTSGETALILAAKFETAEDVRLLIVHGADVYGHDLSGETALHNAASEGEADIIKLLLDRGANISARNSQQETALMLAAEACSLDSVKQLLESGADLTESDAHGRTPLHLAAGCRDGSEVVRLLIESGGDMKERDGEGRTAYFSAVEGGCSEVLDVLLQNGASMSEKDKRGETALFIASRHGDVDFVRALLENGADVSETNSEGETALFMTWNLEVFELLVEEGADKGHVNRHGKTADVPNMFYGDEYM